MSHQLPEQEDIEGTYMAVEIISWYIKNRLGKEQPESVITRVWNSILQIEFPVTHGYTTGAKVKLDYGFAGLVTSRLIFDEDAQEYSFITIECNVPALERQIDTWEKAEVQLTRYLRGIATCTAEKKREFGAIVIGKYVRFYEWNGNEAEALANGASFILDRQCGSVTAYLRFFRDNLQ